MADKGIIFSASMVRALLAGRKSQTRRLLKPAPIAKAASARGVGVERANGRPAFNFYDQLGAPIYAIPCAHGLIGDYVAPYAPGDCLYVRESWYCDHEDCQRGPYLAPDGMDHETLVEDGWLHFMATDDPRLWEAGQPSWRPSIHMPRWASRLWLSVTDVRVQRVQEISEDDAREEGLERGCVGGLLPVYRGTPDLEWRIYPDNAFQALWNSLHTKPGERWEDDPWIVAISFTVHHGNIDSNREPERATAAENA